MARNVLRRELAEARAEAARLRIEIAALRAQQAAHVCQPASAWFPDAAAACTCGTTSAVCRVHPVMRMPTIWCSQQNYWNGCAGGAAPQVVTWNPGDPPLTFTRELTAGACGGMPPFTVTYPAGG